ncbi:MAG: hypothetical protein ABL882_03280 [Sphingopyxis sp.]
MAAQEASLEAAAQQVIATEHAFDAAAARDGQWTAFRAFAAADATMFTPQPVNAQTWLSGRADPPHSVRWQPHELFISCDATLAVTTGAWQRANGNFGYFTTVWRKQADGIWKWVLDHGDELTAARTAPEAPVVHLPDCSRSRQRMGMIVNAGTESGTYYADDNSLWVSWWIDRDSVRRVEGRYYRGIWTRVLIKDRVMQNVVAAP